MKKIINIINRFHKAKILVIGDLILDEYIWGDVSRISPEAPVPVVWANKRTYVPGGAANAASNISSLGGEAYLIGIMGKDQNTDILLSELKKRKISSKGIFIESKRHTTVKTRIIAGHQQVVRVDWEHTDSLNKQLNAKIIKFIKDNIDDFDGLIIEDYGKGVINKYLLDELISLARLHKKVLTVDPKQEHFQYYKGATCITPNRNELENAVRNLKLSDTTNKFKLNKDRLATDRDIELAARQIIDYLELKSLLVTLGEQGMKLFLPGKKPFNIPTVVQEVFDVSGAGDTVISVFTLGICCAGSPLQAAHIANIAAGIVVGKIGTAVVTKQELLNRIG